MATTINEAKKLTLIDGTEISVRPLKVSLLRQFMKKFDEIVKVADDNDKTIGVLLECVQIAMRQYKPEIADDLAALEENIDLPTVYSIVEEAAGIKMSDALGVSA
jgi:inhibitor of KinA sporulation pathway (predicted exonuclease)